MVSLSGFLVLAHGNDPGSLPPVELFGNWALAIVTLVMTAALARMMLAPVLSQTEGQTRSQAAFWAAMSLAVLLAMATWITRQSLVEATSPPPPPEQHMHSVYHGGQITMWGDYHAEVARNVSGEYRMWLSDAFRRPIAARYFTATLYPRDPKTGKADHKRPFEFDTSLDDNYRFVVVDRDIKVVEVLIRYPGDSLRINLEFDTVKGRRSLKEWCGM